MLLPPVHAILQELLSGARAVLGEQFVGMYLYGSLSSGDFNPETSDIDFVVVTEGALAPERVAGLEALHKRLWAAGSYWALHLEGAYVPRADWRRYDPGARAVPAVNEGRFYVGGLGSDWVIQRQVVRTSGVVLAGPPAASLIDPVTPDELRAAAAGIVRGWWGPVVLADEAFLRRPDYQAFAVLTMLYRALYMFEQGDSGFQAVGGALGGYRLPERWRGLIEDAVAWRYGEEIGQVEEIRALIRYTVARAGKV